jgi:transposase
LRDWHQSEKLLPENGGSESKLSAAQSQELEAHLQAELYMSVKPIREYVEQKYAFKYTLSGMTKWLKSHGFSYKKPVAQPAKADSAKQSEFIEEYKVLREQAALSDEPIVFIDAVHPTMATKIECGWIKKGVAKIVAQIASRTRVNVIGGIDLNGMKVVNNTVETVNSEAVLSFFDDLKAAYPSKKTIHVILDQSGYHRSHAVNAGAALRGIKLHFLPPYSPNLNPIERLWKVMNEIKRNNVVFKSAKDFKAAIQSFFDETIPNIRHTLLDRINDNFQTFNTASSS